MKIAKILLMFIFSIFFLVFYTNSNLYAVSIQDGSSKFNQTNLIYCKGDDCDKNAIDKQTGDAIGVNTEDSAADYVQKIVLYLMAFVTLIAIIYVIYAGFVLLIGNGEDDKLTKTKKIIISVSLGIIVMWLSAAIVYWVIKGVGINSSGDGVPVKGGNGGNNSEDGVPINIDSDYL